VVISVSESTRRFGGIDVTGYDRLQRERDLGGDRDRIDEHLGPGGVAASADDADLDVVLAGHQAAGAGADPAASVPGHVVQAEDRFHGEPFEQTVRDHRLGAEPVFLSGLEDQVHDAGEAALGRQDPGGTKDHRHVPVVAAGVHDAMVDRPVRPCAPFGQRQAVHVGA
jgi:hypothetical protein